jgi:hypothetical protein
VELSFFYLLLTLALYLIFYSGAFIARPAFLLRKVVRRYDYFYSGITFLFFAGLVLICFVYFPSADRIWDGLKRPASALPARLDFIYPAARFFRFYYPAGLSAAAVIILLAGSDSHRAVFWSRFLARFDHRQLFPLVLFWSAFWIFEILGDVIGTGIFASFFVETLLLNCCLYFSFFYAIYGFLIINYLFKKKGMPYTITSIIIYAAMIISGDFIVYFTILLLGIGVTDVWMDYTKRKIKFNPII